MRSKESIFYTTEAKPIKIYGENYILIRYKFNQ